MLVYINIFMTYKEGELEKLKLNLLSMYLQNISYESVKAAWSAICIISKRLASFVADKNRGV